ncbi:MAG TPA: short chain dehydrogenase [Candidatus Competibacteraceae bacterium]|nr:short chain dehydrogenase [Candidatus Competibacteraceae bacterium]
MRIILVGASGTIGKAVAAELGQRHQIISAGRNSGDVRVDITDIESIRRMYQQVEAFDAVVATVGSVHFAPLQDMDAAKYAIGLQDKLMGQVNLVLVGREFIGDGGSFTLTSGILSKDPIVAGSSASMVNGALDAWVRAAAIELPRGLRINVVSPNVLQESMATLAPFFRGFAAVPAARVALAYSKSVEGRQTGQVYEVF